LTSAEIDSFFPNLCKVTWWQNFKISSQLTYFNCFFISIFFIRISKKNILSYCLVLNPWNLLNKRDILIYMDWAYTYLLLGYLTNFILDFRVWNKIFRVIVNILLWKEQEISYKSRYKRTFSWTNITNNANKFTFLNIDV
jgi:hypothetical protein